ncbi:MAG: DUF3108 domain-containing protein [Bacteroidia bacterium]|jgi:hypothetical protein|nr:DUF3108 domain-containing protein [Bacteroidia bacterium]
MKKVFLTAFCFVGAAIAQQAPEVNKPDERKYEINKRANTAFTFGEKLSYKVYYGIINGGKAEFEVGQKSVTVNNRNSYYIRVYGKSTGMVDVMFKVKDQFETYLDQEALIPWKATKNVREGNYKAIDLVLFDHSRGIANSSIKGKTEIEEQTQDIVSAIYYARSTDMTNAKQGDVFPVNFYMDGKNYRLRFKFVGREVIKTDLGTFKTLKIKPQLLEGRVFKDSDALTLWVTDDENKVPVRAESEIFVGSIKMDLDGFSGLRNPLIAKIK